MVSLLLDAVDERDQGRIHLHAEEEITADLNLEAVADQRTEVAHPRRDEDDTLTGKDRSLRHDQSPGRLRNQGQSLVRGHHQGQGRCRVHDLARPTKEKRHRRMAMKRTETLNTSMTIKMTCNSVYSV